MAKVEGIAVRHVAELIDNCPCLESDFSVNDRTPLEDGHIALYHSENISKEQLKGRVHVQIKGRHVKAGVHLGKSYTIPVVDLRGFLKLNGVIFFVVDVENKSGKRHAFYVLLNPFKIRKILDQIKPDQKTVSISLRRFPTTPERIQPLVAVALETTEERVFDIENDYLFENMDSITIHSAQDFDFSSPIHLNHNEVDFTTVIRTREGIKLHTYLDRIELIPTEYVSQPVEMELSSGDVTYREIYRRRIDETSFELRAGNGLQLILPIATDSPSGTVTIHKENVLADRVKSLAFLLNWAQSDEILVNGEPVKFALNLESSETLQREYNILHCLYEIIEYFDINPRLILIDDISEEQFLQLETVYRTIILKEELSEDYSNRQRIIQGIGRWQLELICVRSPTEERWVVWGLADPHAGIFAADVSDDPEVRNFIRVTPYDLVPVDRLVKTVNLRLSDIVRFYNDIRDEPETQTLANLKVLDLISAADQEPVRKKEFLQAAFQLNSWLIRNESENLINRINNWQIIERDEGLTGHHEEEIRSMYYQLSKTEHSDFELIQLSCLVLLKNFDDAEFVFRQLSTSDQDAFMEWPLAQLFKRNPRPTQLPITEPPEAL